MESKTGALPPNSRTLPDGDNSGPSPDGDPGVGYEIGKRHHDRFLADDLLRGADQIAEFLFGNPGERRKIYHLAESSRLPGFRLGSVLCARKSTLTTWIAEQERRAIGGGG
jgi:hypothetical protein